MNDIAVRPILEQDLPEIGRFLHENLNRRISAAAWTASFVHPWCASRPNYGFQLRDDGRLVGVFGAIYADQHISGKIEKFCNPHSWCVLESHRRHGVSLVLALLRQTGYHFTMLTPNPKVAEIFTHLRFKPLDASITVFPNLPRVCPTPAASVVESDRELIAQHLSADARRDFDLHRDIPWLRFVAFGRPGGICLVVYKTARWKRLPCATLLHVSNPAALDRQLSMLTNHFLAKHGLLVSRVETRFLQRRPRFSYREQRTQQKLYLSSSLSGAQIPDLYSELVALDI